MAKLKGKKELKNKDIMIRVTESQKKNMVEKAKRAGLSLTAYIEECSNKTAIVSLIESQKILKELHELNLNLKKCNKNGMNTKDLQDFYGDKISQIQELAKKEKF